jgi:hypothetical protein
LRLTPGGGDGTHSTRRPARELATGQLYERSATGFETGLLQAHRHLLDAALEEDAFAQIPEEMLGAGRDPGRDL